MKGTIFVSWMFFRYLLCGKLTENCPENRIKGSKTPPWSSSPKKEIGKFQIYIGKPRKKYRFSTFRSLNLGFPAVWFRIFWFRKVREVCRIHFHLVAPHKSFMGPSYDQKTEISFLGMVSLIFLPDWLVYLLFPIYREELQGGVLDLFDLFSEQFSDNFPDEISRKTRAPNV